LDISIVIPTINSVNIIEKNVKWLDRFLVNNRVIDKYEIIIAAQTSDDSTFDVIKNINLKNVKTLFIKERGKGNGLTIGIKKARYNWVLMIDDDLPYDLDNFFKRSLAYTKDYDIIIGSRYVKKIKHDIPINRKLVSFFYRYLVKILFRLPQDDIQAGIKLIRKKIFDTIGYPSQKGYIWDTELLHNANKKHLKIVEIGVFLKQTSNKLRVRKEIFKMLRDIFELYFRTK